MSPVAVADVAVVGCGVIGLATAERLVARGLTVVVIDPAGVAGGASGASGGLVRAYDPGFPDLAAEGLEIYLRRGWHGRWPAIRQSGSLVLFDAGAIHQAMTATGRHADLLSANEIHKKFDGLTVPPNFVGLYESRAGWLPAREVARALLADAQPGLSLLDSARATAVVTTGGRVSGVQTTAGLVQAAAVLLAAGVGSTELARTVGVDLPLRTRSVSYCMFRPRRPGRVPTMVDTTTGAWLRPWNTPGAVLAGVTSESCDVPPSVSDEVPLTEQHRVRDVLRHRYPELVNAEVIGGVTAFDAMAPAKGAVTVWNEPAGLVTATGWNGGGFKLAPAVGSLAAEQIHGLIGAGLTAAGFGGE
ncbi:glycine/D-amino acid oxidase-like deaminating enzyme [Kibdelosporangium banguiense]|uniref:Glycine/D-amino acid oxidase-like deaminating enzyme n=1 Tax=Kibdelosporangium banguiense TaxID=1365924 RepID=A0ABS4TS65_9PSEU|nr:FAD-dependent oxidoreductase [Kibdelosporangium banguiense]MBP2327238.1 glycine/D-amino acid oxidase-like deaminating enzyme [Kibdelosporangium banguiense]